MPADATASQNLIIFGSFKSRLVLIFLVPAHLGGPGERAFKRVCVCVLLILRQYRTKVIYKNSKLLLLHYYTRLMACFPGQPG